MAEMLERIATLTAMIAYGQAAHELHARRGMRKRWRASYPPTEEEKEAGRAAADRLEAAWTLSSVKMPVLIQQHRAYLTKQMKEGDLKYRASYSRRLVQLDASVQLYDKIPVHDVVVPMGWSGGPLTMAEGCFLTTVRGWEHGQICKVKKVGRRELCEQQLV